MKSSSANKKLCAYCGVNVATEREHVFARSMFPKDKRQNLVIVPTCSECNDNYQKDEEYFRLMNASAYPSFKGSKPAQAIWPTIERMINNRGNRG